MNTIHHGNEDNYIFSKRCDYTVKFVDLYLDKTNSVLDIGCESKLGKMLAEKYGCEYINTVGDLDGLEWRPAKGDKFDTVFCFEVLEHLLNPLLFLEQLKQYLNGGADIFISTPYRLCVFRSKETHWKETSWQDFDYLLERAGYILTVTNYNLL